MGATGGPPPPGMDRQVVEDMEAVRDRAIDLLVKYEIIDNRRDSLSINRGFGRLWMEDARATGSAYRSLARAVGERTGGAEGGGTRAIMITILRSMVEGTEVGRRIDAEREEMARRHGVPLGPDPEYSRRRMRETRAEMDERRL